MRRGWRKPQFFSSCLGHVVGGSSPPSPVICGSSSIGRAPAFQAGCCEFKSRLSLHRLSRGVVNSARIERYIQQFYNRTCNPRVAGSSPARYSHWKKRQLSWQSRYMCILKIWIRRLMVGRQSLKLLFPLKGLSWFESKRVCQREIVNLRRTQQFFQK